MFLHYCGGGGRQNAFHFKIKYYVIKYFSTKLGTLFIYHFTPFYKTFTDSPTWSNSTVKIAKGHFSNLNLAYLLPDIIQWGRASHPLYLKT